MGNSSVLLPLDEELIKDLPPYQAFSSYSPKPDCATLFLPLKISFLCLHSGSDHMFFFLGFQVVQLQREHMEEKSKSRNPYVCRKRNLVCGTRDKNKTGTQTPRSPFRSERSVEQENLGGGGRAQLTVLDYKQVWLLAPPAITSLAS